MFHTPAHKQPAAAVIHIERGNDLIFPAGNERGEFSEPLWLASINGGRRFHGQTPEQATARCRAAFNQASADEAAYRRHETV